MTARGRLLRPALWASLAYVVIGLTTAALAGAASTSTGTTAWRLTAWLLSLATFATHIAWDRLRAGLTARMTARHAAVAVAGAAFVLAALGPVRAHWGAEDFRRATLLSLVLWPILTGVPAFLAAWAAGSLLGRAVSRLKTPGSARGEE